LPYIKKHEREILDSNKRSAHSAGELNYGITNMIIEYFYENGTNYQTFNDVVGVLECAKLELYRRKIGSYEDAKINDNGDVYPVEFRRKFDKTLNKDKK
jgi:hypothetical protein